MGELVSHDSGYLATQRDVDRAVDKGIAHVHKRAYSEYRAITAEMVHDANSVKDEQLRRYLAPMVEATAKQLGGQLLMAAEEASEDMRAVARQSRRRISQL